jgi:hypothetical protein
VKVRPWWNRTPVQSKKWRITAKLKGDIYLLLEAEKIPVETKVQRMLSHRICDLGLKIEGSWLETAVHELYRELDQAGLIFHPQAYLSDEWGCPQEVPIIGIPFYLADAELSQMEGRCTGIAAENPAEIQALLRHECGHAYNYAYRLHETRGWQKHFGHYSKPYRENYSTRPFSARFVRHIPAWYGQKHPDEDFAETFAVWLTQGSHWQEVYAGAPALAKLQYVDRILRQIDHEPPAVTTGLLDRPVEKLSMTLDSWYASCRASYERVMTLHNIINEDLKRLLPARKGQPAYDFLQYHKAEICRYINFWTGIDREAVSSLLNEIIRRLAMLKLKIPDGQRESSLITLTAFLTTLAMNHQLKGKFIEE